MLLSNIIVMEDSEKEEKEPGTYVAGYFSEESQDKIYALAKKLGVPKLIPKDKYHVTIIFSKKTIAYKGLNDLETPWEVTAKQFHVFPTSSGEKQCLVLKLNAPDLVKQHKSIMKEYDATYDFDEYIPHVTLSYDMGDFELPDNAELKELGTLEIVSEIAEPINNDFVASL